MHSETQQIQYMQEALREAQKAYALDEVPIGCVIVDAHGTIIGRGYNQVESRKTQTAHAECAAINEATAQRGDWRLDDCTVYVTLEPCAMCMNLLLLSRVVRVVYAASSPVFGYSLDKDSILQLYRRDAIDICKGLLQEEASKLLKQFFQKKREEKSDERKRA